MKYFVLDSTYKDAIIINGNDDILITSSNNLPYNSITHHTVNLLNTSSNYNANCNKNDKFNIYNVVNYL